MGKVTKLREYTKEEDWQHVTFDKSERENSFNCSVCGHLPVIGGVVIHTMPNEDHEDVFGDESV